jgi:filamin
MAAVMHPMSQPYHQQNSTKYHYSVPDDDDELSAQPSIPRQIDLAAAPKQPAWKKIQEKTFTNWINERLKATKTTSSYHVENLHDDLADGIVLARLLENLSNKKVKGIHRYPSLKAHYIDNLSLCLDFMRNVQEIKLVNIHPEELYKGNMTIIMGLIWTLIQKYQIKTSGVTVTTRKVMIDWLRAMLPEWNISNLTTDWNDGRALLVMIDRIKPGLIPNLKTLDPTKRRNNCALAINQARTHLKIPALLSHGDLSNPEVDDISTMTYFSQFLPSASSNLLKWVRKMIPHKNVKNLTSDWNDGTCLAALLEAKFPGILPKAKSMSPANARENIEKCLDLAEQRIGIVPNMDVEDLMDPTVDELPVMTFLTQIRYGQLSPLPDMVRVYGHIGDEMVRVGQNCQFTVDASEAGPGKLFIDAYYVTSGRAIEMNQTKSQKNVHVIKYVPKEAGTINFDVLWSDTPVPDSPFIVDVEDAHPVKLHGLEKLQDPRNVDEPIELLLDASQAPPGGVPKVILQYGFGPPVEANIVSQGDGKYSVRFVPPNEGMPKLIVSHGNKKLDHLSQDIRVVDYRRFTVIPVPDSKQFRTFERVEFSVRSDGPSLDILQIMAICGDVQVPLKVETTEGHVGNVAFTPTMAGIYSVEVACGDRLVKGSPFLVRVIDPSQIALENKFPRYLHIGVPFEFKLDTRNAGPGTPNVSVEDRALEEVFEVEIVDDDQKVSGTKIIVTPKEYGEFVLSLTWSGSHVTGSPFHVAVCDPSRCEVSGDIAEKKAYLVGRPVTFTVATNDAWINQDIKPIITAQGPSQKYKADLTMIAENKYQASFTPYEVGPHTVSVTFGDKDVPGSPYNIAVMTMGKSACSATGSGLRQAYTSIPATFQILASHSGLVEAGVVKISVTGVVNKKECKVRVRDNQNGTYDVAYLTEVPGAYLITITYNDNNIPGSPFKLNALMGPDPSKCVLSGPAMDASSILQIGKPIDFHVDTSKAGNGNLQVKAVGPKGIQARVYTSKSDKPGVHDIRLDPIRHGKYRVSTRFSNKHVPKSPFIIKVYQGADPTKCRAYGNGLEDGIVGEPGSFTIETRDAGAGTLQVRLHGVKDAFKIDIKPKDQRDPRTLIARYDATKPGEYLITIKWSDVHIPGSPFRVRLVGDAVDAGENVPRPTPKDTQATGLGVIAEDDEEVEEVTETTKSSSSKKSTSKIVKQKSTEQRGQNMDVGSMPMFQPTITGQYEDVLTKGAKASTISGRGMKPSTSLNFSKNSKTMADRNKALFETYNKQEQLDKKIQSKMTRSKSLTQY